MRSDNKADVPVGNKPWYERSTLNGCIFAILCFIIGFALPFALIYMSYLAFRR